MYYMEDAMAVNHYIRFLRGNSSDPWIEDCLLTFRKGFVTFSVSSLTIFRAGKIKGSGKPYQGNHHLLQSGNVATSPSHRWGPLQPTFVPKRRFQG